MKRLNDLAIEINSVAQGRGWWDKPRQIPELLCLVHSEISEALEEYRNGKAMVIYYGTGNKPEGMPIELADAIIRILDLTAHLGINIEEAIKIKMAFNETRPYRHGGKLV